MDAPRLPLPVDAAKLSDMIGTLPLAIALIVFTATFSAPAQTNIPATNSTVQGNPLQTLEFREQLRARCIAERRSICGKILRILPEGILVESGYTNLLREPLTRSWLAPGTVTASRAENLVERREPGAVCVGTVLVTDLPRGRPRQFDYVILCGYPTGEFSYTSVGTVRKTVRRFSANLEKAVRSNLAATRGAKASPPAGMKDSVGKIQPPPG
jgi:hypothetical protein